jgi:hypothetical protein
MFGCCLQITAEEMRAAREKRYGNDKPAAKPIAAGAGPSGSASQASVADEEERMLQQVSSSVYY